MSARTHNARSFVNSFVEHINIFKHCRSRNIPIWSCPRFVFFIMGILVSLLIVIVYFVARNHTEPEFMIMILTSLSIFLFVIMYILANAFERIADDRNQETERAKKTLELRDQFIRVAVHDLVSSATALKWGLRTIEPKLTDLSIPEKEMFANIRERNEQLITLARRILVITRIESEHFEATFLPTDIVQAIDTIKDEVLRIAVGKKVIFESDYPTDTPMVSTDITHLREIMLVLTKNAIRFSNQNGGKVMVAVKTSEGRCVIDVTHNGVMMNEEERAHIFEKYWRSGEEGKIEGTSFGMYIAKELTERIGGTISFISTPEQTTFSITLPLAK